MKIKIYSLALALLVAAGMFDATAQSLESNAEAYQAYLERSTTESAQAWRAVVAAAESAAKGNSDRDAKFKLALAHFGLLNSTMRSKDEALFDQYVDAAVANLEAIKGQYEFEARAILGAIYGLQLAYTPSKGMFLGPRSSALLSQARKGAPNSPLVWKLYGNSKLHTPKAYGGDVEEAIAAFEKSVELYEAKPAHTKDNWLFIDTMAFLGQAYVKAAQPDRAVAVYEKALLVEPDFAWVKYSLLPAAQNGSK